MCVTHGMPCVNMHGTFEDYIRGFTSRLFIQARGQKRKEGGGGGGGWKERKKEGKEKKRKKRKEKKK